MICTTSRLLGGTLHCLAFRRSRRLGLQRVTFGHLKLKHHITLSITFEVANAEITVLKTSPKLIPPSTNTPAEKTRTEH
ncbi:hypothetical protein Y032_0016g2989 [Ancylostoma ceylanicum]|uniref:Uncharacterized protein n=1 Tax=Ancylostoma ceylanicum TaxID=53326 RepID=A0A016V7Z0_9BILA|nr:hypothetical protein Y032_0016g2989 [Ancylostoma ceylanicum]